MGDALCRDCRTDAITGSRCPACGSPRLLSHPERNDLTIAHLDCDAFYAAVEKRDRPELRDLPVIIGGGRRGVVATACYVARLDGVRSAMPMFKALALCPKAVVLKPDMARYKAVSRQIRSLMDALTPLVEPLSIDEAFLDLSGTAALHGAPPVVVLAGLQARIEAELGLTVSIGLAPNKYLAKLASDMNKPRGFTIIGRADAAAVLAPLPVERLWGVGAAAGKRLRQKGYGTLGDLQGLDDRAALALGEDGPRWVRLARGEDNRAVTPGRARKSVSSERTLDDPVTAPEDIDIHLRAAAERVGRDLRRDGWFATAVTIKLKTAAFQSITRSHTLERPSQSTATLLATARTLAQPLATGTAYRLIGVGCEVTRTPPVEQDLFTGTSEAKRLKLEHTLDKLAERFGNKVGWGPAKPSR